MIHVSALLGEYLYVAIYTAAIMAADQGDVSDYEGNCDHHLVPWTANVRRDGCLEDHLDEQLQCVLASGVAAGGSREGESEGAVHVLRLHCH